MQIFLWLWGGQLLSRMGSELTAFALGIWVYQQTQSVSIFAILLGLNVLPVIFLSPLIGSLVDRWPRWQVMIGSDFGAGISTIILAVALFFQVQSIVLIGGLILLNSVFSSFMSPAFIAATSELVPEGFLDRASGLNQTSNSVAYLVAPLLGGALLPLIGLPGIILIDLSTFCFAVITQLLLAPPKLQRLSVLDRASRVLDGFPDPLFVERNLVDQSQASRPYNDQTGMMVAIHYLQSQPGLIALLSFFVAKNFISAIAYVATTPYVLSFASELELGTILSAGGMGMVIGGLIISLLPSTRNRVQTIVTFSFLNGLTLIVLAWQSELWSFMIGAFLFYFAIPLIHGSGQVLFQTKVPTQLHGRVFALNEALAGAAVPLGYVLSGPLADYIFNPLLTPNGVLASSLGPILGIGSSRGLALMFVLLGFFQSVVSLLLPLYRPFNILDKNPMSPTTASSKINTHFVAQSVLKSSSDSMLGHLEPIVHIQDLNHYFGKGNLAKQVLYDINLKIHPGEIVILTGPSGSGKTTLLTLIGALRTIQHGSLKIFGQELNRASSRKLVSVRREIGYIFQGHNLLPFMTARQNVRMALALKRHPSRRKALSRVDEILNSVGLGDRLNYYPKDLSGGQKQRVAIARALVNEASLILADEPTASLDSKTGRDVVTLMYRLAKEQGSAIVLVTHDNRILDIADRIVHLEDGRLGNNPMPFQTETSTVETTGLSLSSSNGALANNLSTPHHHEMRIVDQQNESSQAWSPFKIVCIDDSITVLSSLKAFLQDDLFSLFLISDPVKALLEIAKIKPDMVILDINMPGLDGYQLCTLLRAHQSFKDIPVIAITGSPQSINSELIQKARINEVLLKPFDQCDITTKIFPFLSC